MKTTRIHNANPQSQDLKNSTTRPRHGIHTTHEAPSPTASPSGSQLSLNFFCIGSGERAEHRYVLVAENRVCVRACVRQQRTDKCTLENRSCTGGNAQELTFEIIKILARDEMARSSAIPPPLYTRFRPHFKAHSHIMLSQC
jgi:hypothetical protein